MKNTKVFLKDRAVVEKIIDSAKLTKEDVVIEIGSGEGVLTKEIAKKAKHVYAIEYDLNLLDASKMELSDFDNITFVHGDALEIDFPTDANKIMSNLPYAISSPITEKIVYYLNSKPSSTAILMYQKEFADRMLAIPGIRDYSMLSVFCQYSCNIRKIITVSKRSFRPVPSVDSTVIELTPKPIHIDKGFLEFCHSIFQHKKKNLYSAVIDSRRNMLIKDREQLRERLKSIDQSYLNEKVFMLEIEELVRIHREMVKLGICQE
ncbi:MAG: 16S rRNA (adenine(1518)-N(6)/adenine(1519)-N(6))-dimethyltransferase RsmA [Candidatus Parvarchaeota archaeon]|nr:16S rRNA (adenine(1518)-N(6)/adenine(1519)-N(6))-dimethyltransferase RsmA [Candidatus Parvarchaeota archaeon]